MRLLTWALTACGVLAGFGGDARAEEDEEEPVADEGEGNDLPSSPRWRRLALVWLEAEAIASGQKAVDERSRARVLAELAAASGRADALAKAGLLSAEEHALVRKDVIDLIAALNALAASSSSSASAPSAAAHAGPSPAPRRPQITCYGPRRIDHDRSVREVGMRLAARLPLLRKLVVSRRIQAAVASRLVIALRGDVTFLESTLARGLAPQLSAQERVRLKKLARDVKAAVTRLERKLRP